MKQTRALGGVSGLAQTLHEVLGVADTVHAEQSPTDAPKPAPSVLSVGAERYELGALLGQGGMGRVLTARDRQFGRTVALKELTSATPSLEALRRFLQESVITANLEHPGIVAVYERGVREGKPFYTMRRVEGRTLSEALASAGSLRERLKFLPAIVRLAHTLGFAHERGVVHRDLKPDNVVLGKHGETILLDWGIARVLAGSEHAPEPGDAPTDAPREGATVAGAILGTPAYMAPEQALGDGDAIDARTDVFALGAVLYELLAGRAPYQGETVMVLLAQASQAAHPPLEHVAPGAPLALRQIVARAMAKKPADRFGSAAEVAAALEDFQADALTGRESPAARWFASASGVAAVGLLLWAATAFGREISSFREQGQGALLYPPLTVLGLGLSLLEWRTMGRYAVRGLAAALVGVTVMAGLASTATGFSVACQALMRVARDRPERFNLVYASALWEVLGNITVSLLCASLQWLALALASRAADRAAARARGKSA